MQRNAPLVGKLLFLGFSHGLKWRGRDGIRKSMCERETRLQERQRDERHHLEGRKIVHSFWGVENFDVSVAGFKVAVSGSGWKALVFESLSVLALAVPLHTPARPNTWLGTRWASGPGTSGQRVVENEHAGVGASTGSFYRASCWESPFVCSCAWKERDATGKTAGVLWALPLFKKLLSVLTWL